MPYNYVLQDSIRHSTKTDCSKAIIIFDEAHNIENIAQESCSFEISFESLIGTELYLDDLNHYISHLTAVKKGKPKDEAISIEESIQIIHNILNHQHTIMALIDSLNKTKEALKQKLMKVLPLLSQTNIHYDNYSENMKGEDITQFFKKAMKSIKMIFKNEEIVSIVQGDCHEDYINDIGELLLKAPHFAYDFKSKGNNNN